MRAIILAAGVGRRLGDHGDRPKCLLEFGGRSLLERHLAHLDVDVIEDVNLCVGYKREQIEAAVPAFARGKVNFLVNEAFREGSLVSLWQSREVLRSGEAVVLMDADVLYAAEIIEKLLLQPTENRFLADAGFEAGEEPVKICRYNGRIVEFRKRLAPDLDYTECGESVGFFSFTPAAAARLADIVDAYVASGRRDEPYEEAVRDLALARPEEFVVVDVTGLPWIEIDFPEDIGRARDEILPQINRD